MQVFLPGVALQGSEKKPILFISLYNKLNAVIAEIANTVEKNKLCQLFQVVKYFLHVFVLFQLVDQFHYFFRLRFVELYGYRGYPFQL